MNFPRSLIVQLVTIYLFDKDVEVVKRAMKRLAKFSAQDDGCLEMLRLCLFTTIMGFMLQYSDSAEIIASGCTIFGNLIRLANEEELDTFLQFGFVDDFVTFLLGSPDRYVLISVLGTMGQLASKGYFVYALNSFFWIMQLIYQFHFLQCLIMKIIQLALIVTTIMTTLVSDLRIN